MLPVLCATAVPAGSPAGIASLNFCRLRISIISASAARSHRLARSRAVEAASAGRARSSCCSVPCRTPSGLPRRAAPACRRRRARVTVARMFSTPSFSMSRFAAKLLLTVIIASQSCRERHRLADRRVNVRVRVVSFAQRVTGCRRRCCGTRCGSGSGSSSESSPAAACRNSSIITGTFIVLAA